jgi:3-hydroxyacyl-[acyl-carrier-protein] dehydratase
MKQDNTIKGFSLNIDQIKRYLNITAPFLMIDYVNEIIPGKSAHSFKKLTDDDWFFKCHLEREQVMPGTLQIEAMLQTLALTIYTLGNDESKPCFQISTNVKFFSKVSPGDQFFIHADLLLYKRGIAKGVAVGKVNDKTVSQGEFTFVSPHAMPVPQVN